jgi:DNA (cytosine-5)-methyltransferase 1
MTEDNSRRDMPTASSTHVENSVVKQPGRIPTFIDLFAGCGGLSLGLLKSGWRGICAIEKDAFAFETLKANLVEGKNCNQFAWPKAIPVRPMRIAKFLRLLKEPETRRALGPIDLVAGGPPCQGFSFAGKRKHDDPRNVLFRDYIRAVAILRPKLLLIENVLGVAMKHGKRKLAYSHKIERALKKIGYECYMDIHRALDFGVPQERPRCFFVGVDVTAYPKMNSALLDKIVPAGIEVARVENLKKKKLMKLPIEVRDAIGDLRAHRKGDRLEPADVPRRMQVKYKPPQNRSAYLQALSETPVVRMDSMRLALHSVPVIRKWKRLIKYCIKSNRRGVNLNNEERAVLKNKKTTVIVLHPNRPSHTLTSLPDDLLHYCEPRILTVRECARIQSFPDWFVFRGKYTTGGDQRVKECPRYTQVANAVAPFVGEALGSALMAIGKEIADVQQSVTASLSMKKLANSQIATPLKDSEVEQAPIRATQKASC